MGATYDLLTHLDGFAGAVVAGTGRYDLVSATAESTATFSLQFLTKDVTTSLSLPAMAQSSLRQPS